MNPSVGLYYPYIHIQDVNWLKASLLYWDEIRRIVPASLTPVDDADVRTAVDAGLLIDTSPAEYVTRAADTFITHFVPLFDGPGPLRSLVGSALLEPSLAQGGVGDIRQECPPYDHEFAIHIEKMTHDLLWRLRAENVNVSTSEFWVRIPQPIGVGYLSCLAAEIARRSNCEMVTDSPVLEFFGEYLSFAEPWIREHRTSPGRNGVHLQDVSNEQLVLLDLGLPFPGADDLSLVPMSKIVRFHRQYAGERQRFRNALQGIMNAAQELPDEIAFADYLRDNSRAIQQALADQRESMLGLRVEAASGFLKASCPSLLAMAAMRLAEFSRELSSIVAGTGVGIALLATWMEHKRKHREAVQRCPWHYLLRVQRRFPSLWEPRQ